LTENVDLRQATQIQDVHDRALGKKILDNSEVYVSNVGGAQIITVTGICTKATLDLLLYGVLQEVTEAAGPTNFAKTFVLDENSTGSSVTGRPNQHYTLLLSNPIPTNESIAITSAVLQSLTISKATGTNAGRLSFSATFFSGFDITPDISTDDPSDWISAGCDFYTLSNFDVKQFGALGAMQDVVLTDWSIVLNSNIARGGEDSSGNAEYYHITKYDVTAEISIKYDQNTDNLIDRFRTSPACDDASSAMCELNFTYNDGSATDELDFALDCWIVNMPFDFGNDAGVYQAMSLRGMQNSTNDMLTITMINQTDRGW
jgi:hypothetical protein